MATAVLSDLQTGAVMVDTLDVEDLALAAASVETQDTVNVNEAQSARTPPTEAIPSTTTAASPEPIPITEDNTKPSPPLKPKVSKYATSKASKAQQRRLLHLYITRFCKHFRKFYHMQSLNLEVQTLARQNHFTDLGHFHSEYFVRYMETLAHSLTMEEKVRDELAKFAWAAWHWWGQCVRLSMQSRRREMVKMVVETLKGVESENRAFHKAVDEFCRVLNMSRAVEV